jgi:hypothetical protein
LVRAEPPGDKGFNTLRSSDLPSRFCDTEKRAVAVQTKSVLKNIGNIRQGLPEFFPATGDRSAIAQTMALTTLCNDAE